MHESWRWRSLVGLGALVVGVLTPGCGATPGTPTPGAPNATGGDAVERCLAVAGAKRERRADEPAKVSAKHILVKYGGAKKADAAVTRTREQACLRAQGARAELEHGTPFADVVRDYSEERGAVSREGALGPIERSHVAPPFADAAFELRAGEVSHVVETEFGFHIIMRTE